MNQLQLLRNRLDITDNAQEKEKLNELIEKLESLPPEELQGIEQSMEQNDIFSKSVDEMVEILAEIQKQMVLAQTFKPEFKRKIRRGGNNKKAPESFKKKSNKKRMKRKSRRNNRR